MAKVTQFNVGGTAYRFGDLTIGELEVIERALSCSWGEIEPVGNAQHARAVLTAFLSRTQPDDAVTVAAAMTLNEFLDSVTVVDDDEGEVDAPKANGASSTKTPPKSLTS